MRRLFLLYTLLLTCKMLYCQEVKTDAARQSFGKRLLQYVYKEPNAYTDSVDYHYESLKKYQGKVIGTIKIQPLKVFGPTFDDTLRYAGSRIERWGNMLQTSTNPKVIEKSILVQVGDTLNVDKILENERVIRSYPYIQDVKFLAVPLKNDTNIVDIIVLTKDVFSFGVGVNLGLESGKFEMYNHNIWGIGHQISVAAVGHSVREPYVGFETSYSIRNTRANMIDMSAEYYNTYKQKGAIVHLWRDFLLMSTKWGGGIAYTDLSRVNNVIGYDNLYSDSVLSYKIADIWGGYGFNLNKDLPNSTQLVFSGRYSNFNFANTNNQRTRPYYSDSELIFGSISLSKRSYTQDHLIYSYGVTEDIPKGFLHEYVFGYENNDYAERWYSHLYFSSGNYLNKKQGYLYGSLGIGTFFNARQFEEGQIEVNHSYISRLFPLGTFQFRQFIKLNYLHGFNRYDEEHLYLKDDYGIRGFRSDLASGTKKVVLNVESVFFQRAEMLGFKLAFFGFFDLGVVSENRFVFNGRYYSGIGGGIRLRNESLVFRTVQLRLAYYPGAPSDIDVFGVSFREIGRNNFYNFQPRKPAPLQYW